MADPSLLSLNELLIALGIELHESFDECFDELYEQLSEVEHGKM